MMDNKIFWVWLTNIPNMTTEKITYLLEHFDSAKDIYEAKDTDFSGIYGINQLEINSLCNKSLETAEKIVERCKLVNAKIISYDDIHYPDSLRRIINPPYVLYIRGEIMQWDRLLGIAVVGTRKFTQYGKDAANYICKDLAMSGITIISGMARGIDSLAAIAALKVGNKTIAVLGCGIDVVYPPENEGLMRAIERNGAVITEYPPGSLPLPHHFPERNRIMSGLARGTLVIEAPIKSGTIITANYALESGKDLFAVPGHIFWDSSRGTNMLIRQGAKLVMSAKDVIDEYVYEMRLLAPVNKDKSVDIEYNCKIQEPKNKTPKKEVKVINNIKKISIEDKRYNDLSQDEKRIISLLIEKNLHIDDIVRKSEIEIKEINSILVILEMKGFISKLPANNYRLNI